MVSRAHACPQCGIVRPYVKNAQTLCWDCYIDGHKVRNIDHGTDNGYRQHLDTGVPYSNACGCLTAHNTHVREQRHERGERKTTCAECGEYVECRADRNGVCAKCWRAAHPMESPAVLRHGAWVPQGGVLRWVYGATPVVWDEHGERAS